MTDRHAEFPRCPRAHVANCLYRRPGHARPLPCSILNQFCRPAHRRRDGRELPPVHFGLRPNRVALSHSFLHNTPTRTKGQKHTQKREGQHLAHVTLASFLCSQHATRTALTDTFHACERFLLVLHSHRLSLFVNSGYVTSFAAIIYHILICDREKVRRRLRNNRGAEPRHCAYPAAPGHRTPTPYRSYSLALHALRS